MKEFSFLIVLILAVAISASDTTEESTEQENDPQRGTFFLYKVKPKSKEEVAILLRTNAPDSAHPPAFLQTVKVHTSVLVLIEQSKVSFFENVLKTHNIRHSRKGVTLVKSISVLSPGDQTPNWTKMKGELKQIAASEGIICGVNTGKQIYCATTGITTAEPNWIKIPGPSNAKQIALYGREMVLVTDDTKIMRAYYNENSTSWIQITGNLEQISIDGAEICGGNAASEIYCSNYNRYSICFPTQCNPSHIPSNSQFEPTYDWNKLQGGLKQVEVRAGRLFGVNSSNKVYYGKSYGAQNFVTLSGTFVEVSYDYDYGRICGINTVKQIYCATQNIFTNPTWELLEVNLDNLSLWGNALYGTINGNAIYYHTF